MGFEEAKDKKSSVKVPPRRLPPVSGSLANQPIEK
jgi:hypothetical protein